MHFSDPDASPRPYRQVVPEQIFIGLLLIGACVGVFFYQQKWIMGALEGPTPITLDRLAQISDPNELPNQWVTITAERVVQSGLKMVSRQTRMTRARFVLVQVKDRWLVTEQPIAPMGKRMSGYISRWTHKNGTLAVGTILTENPKANLMPFQFNTNKSPTLEVSCLLVPMAFFALGGLFAIYMGFNGGGAPKQTAQGSLDVTWSPLPAPGDRYR